MRKPCRCNSCASLRVLLHVQRKGDSGSPRVVGPTNAASAWKSWGSVRGLRPPPVLRILPPSSAFPAPLFNSRIPAWIVLRDRPVACATSDPPPCGNACASVAAQSRRCRSSSTLRSAWYFLRIPPTSSFCPMRKAYHTYLICTSYLCAEPKELTSSAKEAATIASLCPKTCSLSPARCRPGPGPPLFGTAESPFPAIALVRRGTIHGWLSVECGSGRAVETPLLPEQLQAKLNLPGVAGLGDLPEVGVTHRTVRIRKLRVVPSVEELRPKLQSPPFPELKVFLQCEVPVIKTRSGDDVSSGISKIPICRCGKAGRTHPVQAVSPQVGI